MISGVHIMVQSRNDKADQAFLSRVLKLSSVDAGGGFLIFGAPPAEIAVHGSDKNGAHELFLMCDDLEDFIVAMDTHNIVYSPPVNRGWGTLTQITLPGGGQLGVYQPHHKRPKAHAASAKKPAKLAKPKATKRAMPAKKKMKKRKKKK